MITDDQVADLVRAAGHAASPGLRIDPVGLERLARAQRARRRAVGGLGAAAAVVLLAAALGPAGAGGRAAGDAPGAGASLSSSALALGLLGGLALLYVACGIATVLTRGMPDGAVSRRVTAAAWGTSAFLVVAVLPTWLQGLLLDPGRIRKVTHLSLLLGPLLAVLLLVWLALALRRRTLGRRRGGLPAAVWLLASWSAGLWVAVELIGRLSPDSSRQPPGIGAWIVLAVLVLSATACARPLLSRAGHPAPVIGSAGITALIAAGVVAVMCWTAFDQELLPGSGHDTVPALLAVAASLGVGLAGARVAFGRGAATPWRTSGLALLTCLLAVAAGYQLVWALAGALVDDIDWPARTGYAIWSVVLAVATTVSLVMLDRRTADDGSADRVATR